jgi:hypothetical protein
MKNKNIEGEEPNYVLTPGGARPRRQVKRLAVGENYDYVVHQSGPGMAEDLTRDRQNLVLAPGGYRHPSLVHRLSPGDAVSLTGGELRVVRLVDNSPIDSLLVTAESGMVPALASGWITNSIWTNGTGRPISYFSTTWQVPPAPRSQAGQTIFLFNALMGSSQKNILQPVLQWGSSHAGGGNYWSVACWYIDITGNAFYHDPVPVSVGDTLVGVMTLTAQPNGSFSYDCFFQGIGGTRLIANNITELLVATETLECYNIQECKDYPNTSLTAMSGVEMKTGGIDVSLSWLAQNRVTDCGQRAVVVNGTSPGGEVDLYYGGSPSYIFAQQSVIAALTRNPNQIDIFGVGADGGLHSEWWNGEWREWFTLAGAGYVSGTPVAAVSRNPNQMDLFVLGMDGVVRSIFWNGSWSGWFMLGGAGFDRGNSITTLSRNPNQIDLFVLGMDGVVRSIFWNGNWSGWFMLGGAGFNQGNPIAALSRNPDQMDLFVLGMDGVVRSIFWNGNWSGWFMLGGAGFNQGNPITALSRNPDQMDLFVLGLDGVVRSIYWNGHWSGWFELDGAGFNQKTPITAVSRNPDLMDIFAVGTDGGVYSTWWSGSWNNWFRVGSGVFAQGTPITALSRNSNEMDLFAVGLDGAVYSAWWDGVWHDWFKVA